MIELLAGIASGGGVAVLSGFVGNIMGYTRGRAEKNITALFVTGQADSLWCMCGDAMSMHDDGTDRCNVIGKTLSPHEIKTMSHDAIVQWKQIYRCKCQRFVGDPDRNPKPAISAPTLTKDLDLG